MPWYEKAKYPQAFPMTDAEVEDMLKTTRIARLGTINEDGTVHIAPIYFVYKDGFILMGTQDVSRKIRNIKRNSQVTVLVDIPDPPFKGILLYGQAELDYEDVIAKRAEIFSKYMPADRALSFAQTLADNFKPVIIRIRPDRIGATFDYAKD
jgi:PPOX class probable F420-dependent enzyme